MYKLFHFNWVLESTLFVWGIISQNNIPFIILPSSIHKCSWLPKTKIFFPILWPHVEIHNTFLSALISKWTEPKTLFDQNCKVVFLLSFKRTHLAKMIIKIHAGGVKKCHFGIFQKGLGWPCPVSAALKNAS